MPDPSPARHGRIPDATQRYGISRSTLYELARKHAGLFKKCESATIVDFDVLDAVFAALPSATFPNKAVSERAREAAKRRKAETT